MNLRTQIRITVLSFFILLLTGGVIFALEGKKIIYFTDRDGLPRNIVSCYVQDKYGYGWVGTGNGIAQFDGYKFTAYDPLKGSFINSMILDDENNLWVGTDRGLQKYNRLTDSFEFIQNGYITHLSTFNEKIYYLRNNRIMQIDSAGISILLEADNLNAYTVCDEGVWFNDGKKGVQLQGKPTKLLEGNSISLMKKTGGQLWIACDNGKLYTKNKQNDIREIEINNHHKVYDIEQIGSEIWVATDGNGIIILDSLFRYNRHLYKKPGKSSPISSNSIYNIYEGPGGEVWISTFGAGLVCILSGQSPFTNIVSDPTNPNSLVSREGNTIFFDRNRYLLGTNYGFSVWDKQSGHFRNFPMERLLNELQGAKVLGFYKDKQYNYWVGTYDGLLGEYSRNFELKKTYHPVSDLEGEMQRIILLYPIDSVHFLIGSHYKSKSLTLFNTSTGETQRIPVNIDGQKRNSFQINAIRQNQFGHVVALIRNRGLFRYFHKRKVLRNLAPEINKRITFKLNDFYHDTNGHYWFATQSNGLIEMSPDGLIFKKWTIEDGLPTNTLLRIESVDDQHLWISTIAGLCRFDMETGQTQIFNYRHGLSANEFSPRASAITPDDKLIFGCSEGFTIVDPGAVVTDTSKHEVIISDIKFHNQSIRKLAKENYLSVPLEEAKEIRLPFRRNSFTIQFFAKDNDLPKYNNFEYRLIGLENDWIYLGETNHTTYTNLSPGRYIFEVKSTNKSNIWNDVPTQLVIEILPPWYRTWWAFAIYFIIIVAIIWLSFNIYRKRLQLDMKLEMAEYKTIKEHELTEKKLAFFTNISHDLKTAVTLISAPVEDLLRSGKLDEEQIKKLKVIKRNADRLFKLNADLIEFRKITNNQLPLRVREVDLHPAVINICQAFEQECLKKNISFSCDYELKDKVWVDPKKIEKILWNLLSNAVKFTHENGKVWLNAEELEKNGSRHIRLIVGDTGKGFSGAEKSRIFRRFYQINKSESILFDGSGIGLSIVKELLNLHHGTISVESVPGKGSIFTITIPAERRHYSEAELDDEKEWIVPESDKEKAPAMTVTNEGEIFTGNGKPKKYNQTKLLIVEDNEDLIQYLSDHFGRNHRVLTAKNGKEGWELAKKNEPDIIISDVKMPKMSGYKLCKKVKNNFDTSHIPVILLTANTETDKKVKGMDAGADSYITKPFEVQYLDAVVNSLLLNRKKARERFLGIEPLDEASEKMTKTDLEFINNLKEIIMEHIANQDLNVDMLARESGVSRSQLNRKLKALTNLTPNNYIKTIRLKKAYELIKVQGIRVSETAYMTGFTDPNYFTICFKKEFGINPSQIG